MTTSFSPSDASTFFLARGLAGQVIALTEAAEGPGAAAAPLLAAAGAHLVLGARRLDAVEGLAQALAAQGGSVRALAVDVGDRRDMQRFISLAHAWFGRLDVIVNSAGPDEEMPDRGLRGALHGIAAGLPLLRSRGRGLIVNLVPRAQQQVLRALGERLRHGNEPCPCLRITAIEMASKSYSDAMVAKALVREIVRWDPELQVGRASCFASRFGETMIGTQGSDHRFHETSLGACGTDHRFPASPSGSWRFFGENGARPRSSGANLN
ncbi:SDR family NAD(P)-dependent oxidoreductase [Roseateles sp. DAIF2]|uniref:SDR family oxidoreductase n=1 Tax=Roseateles sp. DAIF2 TaxID=2714952 RepID=UPI0018A2C12A|nr:SDR family NAD(P)-dependent oxidoreductase [Roseateles sp. DAIF2]QPF75856.1 SDR family NAD(P)-dependent oxidoreductase [Roseateles sp. DAIF2]